MLSQQHFSPYAMGIPHKTNNLVLLVFCFFFGFMAYQALKVI